MTIVQHQRERQQIVELGQSLYDRGYAFGSSGNISVKVDGGYLATPTNSSLGNLSADSLSFLSDEWNHLSGDRPTKEIPMHRAFYAARESNAAVVHLHSTHATALSCTLADNEWNLPYLTPYMVMRLGAHIGVVPYLRPGAPSLEAEISKVAATSGAVLLRNHGLATTGASLTTAAIVAEELEEAAKLYLLLDSRHHVPLSDADVSELVAHM